jgi:hypothetical protein
MKLAFDVIQAFGAVSGISRAECRFTPGDVVLVDSGQAEDKMWIESGGTLFQVERAVFEKCCKWKNQGAPLV